MTRTDAPARDARLPEGDDKHHAVETMFDRIAPGYDRLNRIISLGQDRRWRRHTVAALVLPAGATVLDLGCGTGDLCDVVRADGYAAIGVDFSAGMLAAAHTRAPLARADALALPLPDASADGVVSGFALRNFVDLPRFFRECARVLRRGGRLAALETGEPASQLMRAGHHLWFRRVVPLVGARLAHDAEAYQYLPRSTAYLPPPDDLLALVEAAGFTSVERRTFTAGAVQLVTGTRR